MISIHALRKESDRIGTNLVVSRIISIHALRKESDLQLMCGHYYCIDFNPRSP